MWRRSKNSEADDLLQRMQDRGVFGNFLKVLDEYGLLY